MWEEQARQLAAEAGLGAAPLHRLASGGSAEVWGLGEAPRFEAAVKVQRGIATKALAEAFALRALEAAGMEQVPRVLAARGEASCAGLVMTWVAGRGLDVVWPELDAAGRARVAAEIGAWLAALHEVEVPLGDVRFASDPLPWPERVLRQAEQGARRLLRLTAAPAGLPEDTLEVAHAAQAWLREAIPARLVDPRPGRMIHRDLRPANLLVSSSGELLGVVDFERAGAGDPAWELAKVRWWVLDQLEGSAEPLVAAYQRVRLLPAEGLQQVYRVFEALTLLAYFYDRHPVYPVEALAQLRAELAGRRVRWGASV